MTTAIATSSLSSSRLAPPHLRPARFDDYAQVKRLEAAHEMVTPPANEWRGIWLENPVWQRVGNDWPIGWVLEDAAGLVVGSLFNVPSAYQFEGRQLICANGRGWVVSAEYRGFALWLMDEYFNQHGADLFVNTTVNATALSTFSSLCPRVPLGDWQTSAYWITGYRDFAHAALRIKDAPLAGLLSYPAAAALWLKDCFTSRSLPAAATSYEIAQANGFDSRFDALWTELLRQNSNKLLGLRDSKTLNWHFAMPMRRGRVWIFTASRGGMLRAYCVLKRQGAPHGMQLMRLVDYQSIESACDLLPALLDAALQRCRAEGISCLEHLGCDLPKMQSFDRFAPYRRKLKAWPFYYHASDPALEANLSRPDVWDPSVYDGDASID